jgi:hypothetical protein
MDDFYKLSKRLATAFHDAGLDYAFTGALAVSFYGSPRTTADIDVMIAILEKKAKPKITQALKNAGLDVEERKIDEALESGYNIATFTDKISAYRVDVIFSVEKLQKQAASVAGVETFLQSPEGLVLAKLRMIKVTVPPERALKDIEDVKSILAFSKVDLESIKKRAKQDKTFEILENLINS